MNTVQIQNALAAGKSVFWMHPGYAVQDIEGELRVVQRSTPFSAALIIDKKLNPKFDPRTFYSCKK